MPEQLTKHPDVTLQVLGSGGAQCGTGARQEILTACPAERFCKLPGGEICVYGLGEADRMTQFTAADWTTVTQALTPRSTTALATSPPAPAPSPVETNGLVCGSLGLVVGAVAGLLVARSVFSRR